MFLAFLTLGVAAPQAGVKDQLTNYGFEQYAPERDLPIYLCGCAGSLLLALGLTALFNRRVLRSSSPTTIPSSLAAAVFLLRVALQATLFYGVLFFFVYRWLDLDVMGPFTAGLLLSAPAAAELAAFAWIITLKKYKAPDNRLHDLANNLTPPLAGPATQPLGGWSWLDGAVPLLLILTIYIPRPHDLAGEIYGIERLHHWDYFIMGPLVGYARGGALGSDVYCQYGVGWPLLFSALAQVFPVSYGNLICVGAIYACVYAIGLYALLRLVTLSSTLATLGTFLALAYRLFGSLDPADGTPWRWPSSTMMRAPWDIWCFLLLWCSLNSNRPWLLVPAAMCAGLAVVFVTDTGLFLAVAVSFLLITSRLLASGTREVGQPGCSLKVIAAAALGFSAVVVGGLGMAARGWPLEQPFLLGWLEALRTYSGGVGMVPMTMLPAWSLVMAFGFIALYLFVAARGIVLSVSGGAVPYDLFLATIAVYGLCSNSLFIGRSVWQNLHHVGLPLFIILTTEISRCIASPRGTREGKQSPALWRTGGPIAALVCGAGVMAATPGFWTYPNVLQEIVRPLTERPLALLPELDDVKLPLDKEEWVQEFRVVQSELRTLVLSGKTVAIISDADPILYLAAGLTPSSRYSPLLTTLIRKTQLADTEARIARSAPVDYVFLLKKMQPAEGGFRLMRKTEDSLERLRDVVSAAYQFDHTSGAFEVYRR
jgi:hypothetical protein